MVEKLIKLTNSNESGFYLNDYSKLSKKLIELDLKSERKTILIGVPYALLDLIDFNQFKLNKLDKRCILTENVIQNNALSIIVGGMMFAKYQGLLVFPAVYAIFQYKVFIIFICYY